MAETEKKWKISEGWTGKKLKDYPVWLLNILENRGIKTEAEIKAFLNPKYEDLLDPDVFLNMKEAVGRVTQAKEKNEKIVVYGDYDVDGICATAIMAETLNKIGIQNCETYIPNREEEGYGLNKEAIEEIISKGVNLIISVDCGISSGELIDEYSSKIDFLVCDHHEIDSKKLPQKGIILHPAFVKRSERKQNFCAAGMAFFFAKGLQSAFPNDFLPGQEKWLLDLAAMATICDVIPLTGQNRIIAKWGILVLAKTKRIGLAELAKIAQIDLSEVSSYHVGFILGPRLNAAGRLTHAKNALQLLLTKDKAEANKIAKELNTLNIERQEMCARILEEARVEIEGKGKKDNEVLLLSNKNWPRGVVGIIASRISEEYSKPAIIFEYDGKEHHGSARSVEGFDITAALSSCEPYLLKFGGHAKAAGLSVAEEHFVVLEQELLKIAKKQIKKEIFTATIKIDTEISKEDITEETIEKIESLEPFGYGNPQPVFCVKNIELENFKKVGAGGNHLKLGLRLPNTLLVSGIWFSAEPAIVSELEGKGVKSLDLAFALRYNYWNNRRTIELRVIDARITE